VFRDSRLSPWLLFGQFSLFGQLVFRPLLDLAFFGLVFHYLIIFCSRRIWSLHLHWYYFVRSFRYGNRSFPLFGLSTAPFAVLTGRLVSPLTTRFSLPGASFLVVEDTLHPGPLFPCCNRSFRAIRANVQSMFRIANTSSRSALIEPIPIDPFVILPLALEACQRFATSSQSSDTVSR